MPLVSCVHSFFCCCEDLLHCCLIPCTDLIMVGLLSLPDEVIELVGKQVIRWHGDGVRAWCRVTSTCKYLWDMRLPDSAVAWSMDLDKSIKGKSEMVFPVYFVQTNVPKYATE